MTGSVRLERAAMGVTDRIYLARPLLEEAARGSSGGVIEVDSARSANRDEGQVNEVKAAFNRYIGINYSGAETCASSLKGLRVYVADHSSEPREVAPPPGLCRYWTRKKIAEWLMERFSEASLTVVGIDHGFSFPLQYFEKYDLPHDWTVFLNDFQEHWPTDEDCTYVDFVRDGACGNGAARCGDSRWRRITEVRAGAKSVFHFDVPGSVAKSTPCRDSVAALSPHSHRRSRAFLAVRRLAGPGAQVGGGRGLSGPMESQLSA